ncbi:hypothetical protein ACHAXA_007400 [Cyclostephanos tholiformis]|uniref:Uncharacterized protein n=1 Tax=Cyclostephanos tholiformis TaxID=382380 RepID=A0ABD3RTL2_9STRA
MVRARRALLAAAACAASASTATSFTTTTTTTTKTTKTTPAIVSSPPPPQRRHHSSVPRRGMAFGMRRCMHGDDDERRRMQTSSSSSSSCTSRRWRSRSIVVRTMRSIGDMRGRASSIRTRFTSSSASASSYSSTITKTLSSEVDLSSLSVMDVVLFRRRISGGDDVRDDIDDDDPTTGGNSGRRGGHGRMTPLELGAVQENGSIAPLSAWTGESAYATTANDMMAFVVDEIHQFPGLTSNDVMILDVPSMSSSPSYVDYGSRQVGGGKGPGNPHGEESELIYYVDRAVVEGLYRVLTKMTPDDDDNDDDDDGSDDDDDLAEVLSIDIVVNPDLEHMW